jgi:hypothetical protein
MSQTLRLCVLACDLMRIRVTSKASSRVVLSIQQWPLQLIAVVISGRQFFILWLESFPDLPENSESRQGVKSLTPKRKGGVTFR